MYSKGFRHKNLRPCKAVAHRTAAAAGRDLAFDAPLVCERLGLDQESARANPGSKKTQKTAEFPAGADSGDKLSNSQLRNLATL